MQMRASEMVALLEFYIETYGDQFIEMPDVRLDAQAIGYIETYMPDDVTYH